MKRITFLNDTSRGFVVRAGLRIVSPLCSVNCVWGLYLSPVSLGLQELSGRWEGVWVHKCLSGPWGLFAVRSAECCSCPSAALQRVEVLLESAGTNLSKRAEFLVLQKY